MRFKGILNRFSSFFSALNENSSRNDDTFKDQISDSAFSDEFVDSLHSNALAASHTFKKDDRNPKEINLTFLTDQLNYFPVFSPNSV